MLEIHQDFLSTCLNDCMLSTANGQLLATIKKLLGVCVDFADFLRDFASDDRAFSVDTGSGGGGGDGDKLEAFHQEVSRYDLQFSSVLLSLLDRIAQMGRDNYNERVLNILNRLDFNGFYTRELDQFGCGVKDSSIHAS